VKIYLEIANADPPNAATLCQLGICFQMGIGVEIDASRAVQCYERAVLMRLNIILFIYLFIYLLKIVSKKKKSKKKKKKNINIYI
jgi:hypothetical protein